jgi:hypothetical protein
MIVSVPNFDLVTFHIILLLLVLYEILVFKIFNLCCGTYYLIRWFFILEIRIFSFLNSRVVDSESFEFGSRSGSSLFRQSRSGYKSNPYPNPKRIWIRFQNRIQTGSGLRKKAGSGSWSGSKRIMIHNPAV